MTIKAQATVSSMFAQSVAVITQPGVSTFERFERRGGTREAYIYVVVAALISAVIAAFFGLFHHDINPWAQFVSRLIVTLLGFAVFTGLVFAIGKYAFHGSGTYPEVAYTFALFFVPISTLATIVGVIPVLGTLITWILALVNVFFGFLAVQSSMNIRDPLRAAITLVLSGIGLWIINGSVAGHLSTYWVRGF